jgi:hypothetical protein
VVRWAAQARKIGYHPIPTKSSKPKRHLKQLGDELVREIVAKRLELKRSAEVIHKALQEDGLVVTLSSVKRTLDRQHLLKKRWKKTYKTPIPRPYVAKPGDLVQLDTIHLLRGRSASTSSPVSMCAPDSPGRGRRTRQTRAWRSTSCSGSNAQHHLGSPFSRATTAASSHVCSRSGHVLNTGTAECVVRTTMHIWNGSTGRSRTSWCDHSQWMWTVSTAPYRSTSITTTRKDIISGLISRRRSK